MDALVARERNEPFYNVDLSPHDLQLWRSFIDKGVPYELLNRRDSRLADTVISIVMGAEAELEELQVRPETTPDYIHPGVFQHLLKTASPFGKSILGLFQFGRSYGAQVGRPSCFDEGSAWHCYGAYVILSPAECSSLAIELRSILAAPAFRESKYEEAQSMVPLAKALDAAARLNRGVYLHVTD